MENEKVFSKFYSTDTLRYEDKNQFRNRVLKYVEDFVKRHFSRETYHQCRSRLGINIEWTGSKIRPPEHRDYLLIEQAFESRAILEILDFLTVVYDSTKDEYEKSKVFSNSKVQSDLTDYIKTVNKIFQEESMCYVMHENGRVRYYPDEEFHQAVKNTLMLLDNPKYEAYLKMFNEALDELYKNHNKEQPIQQLFVCVESFSLSMLNSQQSNRLNNKLVTELMGIIKNNFHTENHYTNNDNEAFEKINEIFSSWITMCHKYRHGKKDQINKAVPKELFNFIFSMGVSIFRLLLELDSKAHLIKPIQEK